MLDLASTDTQQPPKLHPDADQPSAPGTAASETIATQPSFLLRNRAVLSLLLIATLSLTLLIVIYSWWSGLENQRVTAAYANATVTLAKQLDAETAERLIQSPGENPVLHSLQQHPNFHYLIIESRHGARLLQYQNPSQSSAIPEHPLSASQRHQQGSRELLTGLTARTLTEFFAPFEQSPDKVIRLGFIQPAFHWPQGSGYYFLLALPLILLTLAAISTLFSFYLPIKKLHRHLAGLKSNRELKPIEETNAEIPLLASFNEFISETRSRLDAQEQNHDTLLMSSKVMMLNRLKAESILNSLPDAIIALDCSGVATYCNDRARLFTGKSTKDIVGKKVADWSDTPSIITFVNRSLKSRNGATTRTEITYQQSGASPKTAEVSALPLSSAADKRSGGGIVIVFHDNTASAHAKRMSDEFVVNVAHELKSPLHVLKLYSESLLDNDLNQADTVDAVNTIYDEVDRMATLINNLLNIAKIELGDISLDRQRVKPCEFLQDIFDNMHKAGKERSLEFELDLPESMSTLIADKDLLRVAINNLLTNAIKYNRVHGSVKLSASETTDRIEISVSDTGVGIKKSELEHIFNKFYRSDDDNIRQQPGHGLGLALARNIVQLHHGSLQVESTVGKGTTFSIVFLKKMNILEQAS